MRVGAHSIHPTALHPACRGLHGRKLESGGSARQDLLFFGEQADAEGAERPGLVEDVWIGLDPAAGQP